MTNKGTVISVDGDNALIKVIRQSACAGCAGRDACEGSLIGECAKTAEVTALAKNTVGAKVGDTVEFTSSTSMTLGIAATVFLVPPILALVSYFVCDALTNGALAPYLVSIGFFALSFVGLFFGIDRWLRGKIKTYVTKILD